MTNKGLLTILIPTFNRQDLLAETLDMFYQYVSTSKLQQDIFFIVGDNASTDYTLPLLEQCKKRFTKSGINFSYYTNEINVGLTRSILKGLSEIRTKFIWVYGDDDPLNSIFLSKIVPFLKKTSRDFLIVPTSSFVNVTEINSAITEQDYSLEIDNLEINELNINFLDLHYGFLNSVILSRKIAAEGISFLHERFVSVDNNYFMKALNYYCHFKLDKESRGVLRCPTVVFQRITTGSYFTKNAEIIEKTFFYDNYEIATFIKSINSDQSINNIIDDRYFKAPNKINLIILRLKSKTPRSVLYRIFKQLKSRDLFLLFLIVAPKRLVFILYRFYKSMKGSSDHPIFK